MAISSTNNSKNVTALTVLAPLALATLLSTEDSYARKETPIWRQPTPEKCERAACYIVASAIPVIASIASDNNWFVCGAGCLLSANLITKVARIDNPADQSYQSCFPVIDQIQNFINSLFWGANPSPPTVIEQNKPQQQSDTPNTPPPFILSYKDENLLDGQTADGVSKTTPPNYFDGNRQQNPGDPAFSSSNPPNNLPAAKSVWCKFKTSADNEGLHFILTADLSDYQNIIPFEIFEKLEKLKEEYKQNIAKVQKTINEEYHAFVRDLDHKCRARQSQQDQRNQEDAMKAANLASQEKERIKQRVLQQDRDGNADNKKITEAETLAENQGNEYYIRLMKELTANRGTEYDERARAAQEVYDVQLQLYEIERNNKKLKLQNAVYGACERKLYEILELDRP